jgi:lysophospholipase L1-like esterase
VRKIRPTSGLIRYDSRNENLDWWQAAKDILATEKPSAIVVMLGLNDRISIRDRAPRGAAATTPAGQASQPAAQSPGTAPAPAAAAEQNAAADAANAEAQPPAAADSPRAGPGASYEFHTDKWGELYEKRIDDMIAALKTKGVPVVWVGLPAIRGPRSTGDMSYLDELFRARAEKAGITYVDVWDGFVDENGRYAVQGPDFEGQTRRLRAGDGIHFTKPGAVKLAHYVEHELRRLMSNHVVPVALPAPEEQAPQNGAPAKSAVGPVVPLTAALGAEGGDLLGGGRAEPPKADPIVLRVLSHGDAIAAPAGRADDFSWPRSEFGTRTTAVGSTSAAGEASAAPVAARSDQKKPEPQPQTAVTEPDPAPAAPPKADDAKKPEPRRQSTGQGRGQGATQGAPQGAAQGAAQANPGGTPAAPPKPHRTRTTQENAPRPPLSIGGWRPNGW